MTGLQLREREGGQLRCPYCHDALIDGEEPARCGACQAVHHATCASELGHCAACQAELSVTELPRSARRCSFFHDCGSNAVLGDSLCHDHRRRVNASVPRPDLAGMHRESLELALTIDRIGRTLSALAMLLVVPLLALGYAADLGLLTSVWAVLLLLVPLSGLGDLLRRRGGRLRTLLEAIPDAVLADGDAPQAQPVREKPRSEPE